MIVSLEMSLHCMCAVVLLVNSLCYVIAQNSKNEKCGIQPSENQFPWLVAIEYEFNNEEKPRIDCTGALISIRHAVTKVKCVDTNEKVAKSVILGIYGNVTEGSCNEGSNSNCTIDGAVRAPIEKFIPHPRYSKIKVGAFQTGSYDIALIRLVKKVSYTDAIRPICLPNIDVTLISASDLELYITGLDDQSKNEILNTATDQFDYQKCEIMRLDRVVPDDLICMKDIEAIDCMLTGGLLVNKNGGSFELIGLLDIGSSCGLAKRFSHMFLYLDWLRSEIPEWTPCGRRKVKHIELIVYGETSKAGDWPWHAAIYRSGRFGKNYICGGTLISKTMVLTAAHCTTKSGVPVAPEVLSVILGKHYLNEPNLESQEKEVESVIVHEEFAPKHHLDNDIALLKLRTITTYNNYVQPACIWSKEAYDRLPSERYVGTVVGWGIDQMEMLSPQLRRANMPRIPDDICIKKNPLFYSSVLGNNKKFCAGWANGTSTCNGDSGGGFFVEIPFTDKADSPYAVESWYIKGIVSLSVAARNKARCDPTQYAVFTDVANYTDWIKQHRDDDLD